MEKIQLLFKALVIGIAGGLIFNGLHIPLPWTLGPLTAIAMAQVHCKMKLVWPVQIRDAAIVLLGYVMGRTFTIETGQRILSYLPLLSAGNSSGNRGAGCLRFSRLLCGNRGLRGFRETIESTRRSNHYSYNKHGSSHPAWFRRPSLTVLAYFYRPSICRHTNRNVGRYRQPGQLEANNRVQPA